MKKAITELTIQKRRQMLDPEIVGKTVVLKSNESNSLIKSELFQCQAVRAREGLYYLKSLATNKGKICRPYEIAYTFKQDDTITFEQLVAKSEQYKQKYLELMQIKSDFVDLCVGDKVTDVASKTQT